MPDSDVIARVYPVLYNQATKAIFDLNPSRRRLAATTSFGLFDQASPQQRTEDSIPDNTLDCLELTFSNEPSTARGFVFGRDPTCDVVLPPDLTAISHRHFAITFERGFEDTTRFRLVVRDLNSAKGTTVTYNGKGGQPRRGFRWILSGHSAPKPTTIVIKVHKLVLLRVVVLVPEVSGPIYDRVRHFLRERQPESLLANLSVQNPPLTQVAIGTQPPGSGLILVDFAELGRENLTTTTCSWNVSTGRVVARKQPLRALGGEDRAVWRREADLLARLSHENIVQFLGLADGPGGTIELHLEAVVGGTLASRLPMTSYLQGLRVMSQCLSAVVYLHDHTPPIVHRHIKPESILVADGPCGIQIRLTDFGLSQDTRDPISLGETETYFPPEFWSEEEWEDEGGDGPSYSPAVDIWSLGVVFFECLTRLPRPSDRGLWWCTRIRETIKDNLGTHGHISHFIFSSMICMTPRHRSSAKECHDHVMVLLSEEHRRTRQGFIQEGSSTLHLQHGMKRLRADDDPPSDADDETTARTGHRVKRVQLAPSPSDQGQHKSGQGGMPLQDVHGRPAYRVGRVQLVPLLPDEGQRRSDQGATPMQVVDRDARNAPTMVLSNFTSSTLVIRGRTLPAARVPNSDFGLPATRISPATASSGIWAAQNRAHFGSTLGGVLEAKPDGELAEEAAERRAERLAEEEAEKLAEEAAEALAEDEEEYCEGYYDGEGYGGEGYDGEGYGGEGYDGEGYDGEGYDGEGYDGGGDDGEWYYGEGYNKDGRRKDYEEEDQLEAEKRPPRQGSCVVLNDLENDLGDGLEEEDEVEWSDWSEGSTLAGTIRSRESSGVQCKHSGRLGWVPRR